jgi:hypothetical protein
MAMANLRDGGVIIIGVSQRDGCDALAGIAPGDLATFNPDVIVGQVNKFASPSIDLDIVTVQYHDDLLFLAIHAREFAIAPVVCKKNGPDGINLRVGDVFVRPVGVPRTTRITSADDMTDLLEAVS